MNNYDDVFKSYDIRGIVPKQIDNNFAYILGKAFSTHVMPKEVAVGYDGRSTSKKFFERLVKGLREQGSDVVDLGQVSTPLFYFGMIKGKYDAGIMITASHNSKNYNGFKLLGKNGEPIHNGNGSLQIKELMEEAKFPYVKSTGKLKSKKWENDYKKFLKDMLLVKTKQKTKPKDLKIIVDQSNGVGFAEVDVISKLFPNTKVINSRIAGTFPGHDPNPLKPQNLKQLISAVKKEKADLGIIFDGDADRVCFVDEKGEFVRPDLILLLLMDDLKKGKIVYEVRSSKYIPEKANKSGMHAILSKAGRTNIVDVMRNEQAEIGGEGSGHYFYKNFKYLDCAGITVIRVLNRLLAMKPDEKKTFSELVINLSPYFHSGEVNLKVKNSSKAFLLIEQGFKDAKKTLFLDGISIYYDEYWFNVRKSNTEPLLRINTEANSKKKLDEITGKIGKLMKLVR
ncbi:phosphomannomutase/phosphoglucomutase [Candidatus Woesearchaeota archaeon]|nr:phosphomannomutase/phosphoglucomutase [Candidatus Woesearchaeota archaeon]MCF7901321.1 phosphomannomutase/phosphoglucomutase [Candidatus Woesearchaeota archaeon]MCF8013995.1 phosphomannomutase/phosphoglucomutase [Candidatus Woesearchaeota archaeon]